MYFEKISYRGSDPIRMVRMEPMGRISFNLIVAG